MPESFLNSADPDGFQDQVRSVPTRSRRDRETLGPDEYVALTPNRRGGLSSGNCWWEGVTWLSGSQLLGDLRGSHSSRAPVDRLVGQTIDLAQVDAYQSSSNRIAGEPA